MSKDFDPYHIWLGIPPKDQPPHHFRLLGLELFEDDPEVIDAAANRQIAYLHKIASGPNRKQSQSLMNEIAVARRCLLTPDRHKEYVEQLRQQLSDSSTAADSAAETDTADIEDKAPSSIADIENSAVASNAKNIKAIAAVVIVLMLVVGGATTWILTRPDDKNASLIEGSITGKAPVNPPSPAIASSQKQNPSSQDENGGQSPVTSPDMFSKLAPDQSDPKKNKNSRNKKKGKSRKGRNNNKGKSKKNKADNITNVPPVTLKAPQPLPATPPTPVPSLPATFAATPTGINYALCEYWLQLKKNSPAELAKFIKNQTKPTGTRYYSKLAMSKDQSARGNWGQRVSGYLIPTVTGSYSFKPTFENLGRMYLSTNASPATKKPVRGKIKLTANRPYYFEIFHLGDGVNDSFRVDWTLPNGKASPIPTRHLAWSLHQVRFVTLGLSKITSTTDLKHKTQTDGSILATKFDRKPTTITVEIQPQLSVITAFEFQAIPDASGDGPGYGSRGSFELSEFVVHPFDSDNAAVTSEKIEFSESDSVANSGVARHCFDGKESTNWKFRGRGEMGRIILIPKKPIRSTKRRFQVTLKFKQNVGHFRIQATGMGATLLAAHRKKLKPPPVRKPKYVNLFVNLGGTKGIRDRGIEWIPSQTFSKDSWGHVGGRTQKSRTLKGTVLGTSIYGLREFRVAVPNGRYLVTLYFSETLKPKRNQRYFQFTIEGGGLSVVDVEKLTEPLSIPKRIRVTDGVLDIRFEKRKEMGATPFLNAISIERRG